MELASLQSGWFYMLDGDRVGDLLDAVAAQGDPAELRKVSADIDNARDRISAWFVSLDCRIWVSASDTIVAECDGPVALGDLPRNDPITWSVGQGPTLSHAHAALAVAKVKGRGCVASLESITVSNAWDQR